MPIQCIFFFQDPGRCITVCPVSPNFTAISGLCDLDDVPFKRNSLTPFYLTSLSAFRLVVDFYASFGRHDLGHSAGAAQSCDFQQFYQLDVIPFYLECRHMPHFSIIVCLLIFQTADRRSVPLMVFGKSDADAMASLWQEMENSMDLGALLNAQIPATDLFVAPQIFTTAMESDGPIVYDIAAIAEFEGHFKILFGQQDR